MNEEHLSAFYSIMNFASSMTEGKYVKFHLNTGQNIRWTCYYGVYNELWFPAWTKSGTGDTIYEAAYEALHSKKRFLAS